MIVRVLIKSLFLVLLISGVIVFNSCKVKYSFSGASISPLAKTFSVHYFQNRAQLVQPQLSQTLTNALIDKIKVADQFEIHCRCWRCEL